MARSLDARIKAFDKALDTRARRLQLCPLHMTKLECSHEFWWVGSQVEFEESLALRERLEPYMHPRREKPSGQFCPICGDEPLWCNACFIEAAGKAQPIEIPDAVMSQAEYDRHIELVKMLQRKPPGTPPHVFSRDEIHLPSPAPIDPTPPPIPLPVPRPAPVPVVSIPAPAPVVAGEEEVDTELAAIVEQLKRRLAR